MLLKEFIKNLILISFISRISIRINRGTIFNNISKLRRDMIRYTIYFFSSMIKIILFFMFISSTWIHVGTSWSLMSKSIRSHEGLLINWFLRINNYIINFLFSSWNLYYIHLIFFPSMFNYFLLVLFIYNTTRISFKDDWLLFIIIQIFI